MEQRPVTSEHGHVPPPAASIDLSHAELRDVTRSSAYRNLGTAFTSVVSRR
ncbi:hypothetical protein [Kineococcus arenarius]|uniref:hypothetical protein n=1 Tax=unclassified Kineococcus TaxID=2621656 RepID=UPI003D7C40D1